MAYSKAKLKSNGDKASPCLKPFLIRNTSDKLNLILQIKNVIRSIKKKLSGADYRKITLFNL
jgi:hypothetical protein